jgi:hypothetical protein
VSRAIPALFEKKNVLVFIFDNSGCIAVAECDKRRKRRAMLSRDLS